MANDTPNFTIEETTGERRKLLLVGRALPYRPLKLEGEQRVEVEYPAGFPVGTAQVFGPTEGDCTIEGYWKDKYLGSAGTLFHFAGAPVKTAIEAVKAMDSLRVQGQRVRVSWGPVLRYGHIKKFAQTWHNIHDCEWSLTFVWTSRAEAAAPSSLPVADGLGSSATAFRRLLDNLRRALREPLGLAADLNDFLASNIDAMGALANEMDDLANAYVAAATSPLQLMNRVDSTLSRFASIGGTVSDRLASTVSPSILPGLMGRFTGGSGAATLASEQAAREALVNADRLELAAEQASASQLLRAQTLACEAAKAARACRDEAILRARMASARPGDIQAQYIAREDEDLRDVSLRFYGTPRHWQALMLYNGMESSFLMPGQSVLIPRQTGASVGEG